MKRPMKPFFLLLVTVSLFGVSCERHEFDETKKLQESHSKAHHAEPAEGHAEGGH
jgi:hypothetical protein